MAEFRVEIISPDGNAGDTLTVEATSKDDAIAKALAIEDTAGWRAVSVDSVPL